MSSPEFFDILFVCLSDGTSEIIHKDVLIKYWSIRDWFLLYHLFQKFCVKHGLSRLEIVPKYYETY